MLNLFFILMLLTIATVLLNAIHQLRRAEMKARLQLQALNQGRAKQVSGPVYRADPGRAVQNIPVLAKESRSLFVDVGPTKHGSKTVPLRRPIELYAPSQAQEQAGSGKPQSA